MVNYSPTSPPYATLTKRNKMKHIEKIDLGFICPNSKENIRFAKIANKINEIIDYLNTPQEEERCKQMVFGRKLTDDGGYPCLNNKPWPLHDTPKKLEVKHEEGWETRFDENFDGFIYPPYYEKLKSFISQLFKTERERVVEEVMNIVGEYKNCYEDVSTDAERQIRGVLNRLEEALQKDI